MQRASRAQKLPRNYLLVYDVVRAQKEGAHASAGEIYAEAKRLQSAIGYSTVYRALDRLSSLGLVLELRVPGAASALYEPARADHAHLFCQSCGRVDDIDYDLPAETMADVAQRRGVVIKNAVITFNGLCGACASRPA